MKPLESLVEGLKLDLEVRKAEVIRGESIRFTLRLSNEGKTPITIKDISPENRAFSVRVRGPWNFDAWGNQMSISVREGEHVDQPREEPRKPLAPGEKWIVQGDLMTWVGDLEPGTYTIRGHYSDSQPFSAESREVEIKVSEAAPVYAQSATQNLPLALSPRATAWLHKTATASELFVLESSPANPLVTCANVPLAKLQMPARVFGSSYNFAPPLVQHMAWNDSEGNLKVLRFRSDLPPEAPISIPLPNDELEPMATPYSDERGNLHVLLATPDGDAAGLLQVVGKAAPAFHPIQCAPALASPRCALWYRDATLAFAWVDPEAMTVFAAVVPLIAPPKPLVGKSVFATENPVISLVLAQRYNEGTDGYDRILYVVCHNLEDDIYYRWQVDLAGGEPVEDGRFEVKGAGTMRLIQSSLTDDLMPLYLFARQDGAVFFSNAGFSAYVPVLNESRKPVKVSDHPSIMTPSSFSKIRGVFVRYIDQGRRFAYAKVS
jgi:hypothetical protein